jgi:RNA polymerase sigma-70 factor, ECF subfamily
VVEEHVVARFIDALLQGDEQKLLGILAPDAVLVGDGGGKVPSIVNPVLAAIPSHGSFSVYAARTTMCGNVVPALVNSGPGMLTWSAGQLISVAAVTIQEGRITAIYSVGNPDKIHGSPTPVTKSDS